MKITILGHVCIDKNTSEHSSYTAAGSPAMFMSKIFKQLPDNQVTIVAPYGTDFLAYKNNVNIYPENPVGERTLIYENITKSGTRQQKAHHRDVASPVPINNQTKKIFGISDILFIAPCLPNYSPKYLRKILSSTKPEALKVLLPQGYYREFDTDDNVHIKSFDEVNETLPLVDIVIVSEQDHANMLSLAKKWVKFFKITVIITLGENGAVAVLSDKVIQLPTRAISENEIVDSVGSGDIFSAGFAYRYQQTNDLKKAGRFANSLARQCLFYTPNEIKIDYQVLI
jgi:hypothetical protein